MIEVVLVVFYGVCLSGILFYCIAEVHLAFNYNWYKRKHHSKENLKIIAADTPASELPFVSIQLPIFNELYVTERLIDAIAAFNYPKERYEIQVLDDSTDETIAISRRKVAEYQAKGYNISLHHRTDRTGYKAGALQAGLQQAKGEFTAIFDADFIPHPDFLYKTLAYFKEDDQLALVQTRWQHINQNYSLLTQVQAFFIDAHFTVEQLGRCVSGYFLNFNGTAGVWRTKAIHDGGGWEHDTLTEDLDLSYRTQLKGWRIKYIEDISSPSELPADMRAFKSQQFRWIKGGAEVAAKMLPRIAKANIPFKQKFNAFTHLLSSSVYIIIFLAAVLSVPLMVVKNEYISFSYMQYGVFFMLSNVAVGIMYFSAIRGLAPNALAAHKRFWTYLPIFLAVTLGLSLHNALAAIRGWLGEKTPFVRTPKFNISAGSDQWTGKKYTSREIDFITVLEGFLSIYFLGAVVYAVWFNKMDLLPFHVFACIGFAVTFWYSFSHAKLVKR